MEVNCTLPSGQVATGQIGATADHLRNHFNQFRQSNLGEFSARNGIVLAIGLVKSRPSGLRRVDGQRFLPTFRKSFLQKTSDLFCFLVEFLGIFLEEIVPFFLSLSPLGSSLVVKVVDFTGNIESLFRIKATYINSVNRILTIVS